ncbi:PMT6 Dolichyl-phosphate-mannose--protein mannosyltransferase 6 [Candida maltosa Xu316]
MSNGYSSGISTHDDNKHISHRHNKQLDENSDVEIEEIIDKTSKLHINKPDNKLDFTHPIFIKIINPLILTAISSFVRLYRIEIANYVVWDEAHFGEFGSRYLKREFYFDVHPPLGKLLVALSGYLAGYNGDFKFDSGVVYPDDVNYVILVTPLAYRTSVLLGFNQFTCWLISIMVIFEQLSLTLSKFILLDSMLLFFTVFTFFGLVNLHALNVKNKLLTKSGLKWSIITGFGVGCVCSVKWVGLFITAVVGIYTVYDLLIKFYQTTTTKTLSWRTYLLHWSVRIFTLIIIPISIYISTFKIHFMVLNHTGPGDGSISTLLQASLIGNDLQSGPRSVAYGSLITLRSQGLSPNLLHSHGHNYPEGSQEQQVTTYGFKDDNNEFLIEFDVTHGLANQHATLVDENSTDIYHIEVKDGDTIRLNHRKTGSYLRANAINAPVSTNNYEVSCFGEIESNDYIDEWVIEVQVQEKSPSPDFQNEDETSIHPVSTNFRLRHKQLGCYLSTTGSAYPAWGYNQGEVVCKYSIFNRDKNTWWNVEKHMNDKLPDPETEYVPPKPKFWKEFILLNYGMMAANGALLPDPDRFDKLSSEWWEWPILHTGLRMCGWGESDIKFFLLGNPLITWLSTLGLGLFAVYCLVVGFKYQRQYEVSGDKFFQGLIIFMAWLLNYVPFILMGRVKYIHHYLPAQYFAIFLFGFILDRINFGRLRWVVYGVLYVGVIATFIYFKDLSFGMEGSSKNYSYLKLLNSWMI